ncbi:MAG: AMP-binding protein [Thermaurantiacus sp.]
MSATDPRLHAWAPATDITAGAIRRFGSRTAVADATETLTYAEMGRRAARHAAVFRALGLGRGSAAAFLSRSRTELPVIVYALQAIGVRTTALHPLGSEADHLFILDDAGVDFLLFDETAFADHALTLSQKRPQLRILGIGAGAVGPGLLERSAAMPDAPLPSGARPDDLLALGYTGGTTGTPKGVMLGHRSVGTAIQLELAIWEWPQQIRFLSATPLSHATAMILPAVLARGGSFHIMDSFDPDAFMETIARERITATFLVPTMLYRLLDHPSRGRYDLSSLDMIVYGAAPMSPDRLGQALEVFGPVFCQLYGQTEAPQIVTYLRKEDHDPARPHLLASCGTPAPGLDVRILDADGHECRRGEIGEICVRGPLVMDGYWKRPEETAAAFRNGWLHTSDMARMDEAGYIYIVDRAKDMIISGGFNVYPREVEDALMSHPGVAAAAVIGVPDPTWGEAVAAFIQKLPEARLDEAELQAHVRRLKGPVQTPKTVRFLDRLPETPVGKVDRKALRSEFWAGRDRQVS